MNETGNRSTAVTGSDVTGPSGLARSSRPFWVDVTAIAIVFSLAIFCFTWWKTNSLFHVLPYLRGQYLAIEPIEVNIGVVPAGTEVESIVRVSNFGSQSRTLVGSQRSCSCITLDELPVEIPAGEHRDINFVVSMPRKPSSFEHLFLLYTDAKDYSPLQVKIVGVAE